MNMSEEQAYEIYCDWATDRSPSLFDNNITVEEDSNNTVEDTGSLFSNSVEGNVSLFDSLGHDRSYSLFGGSVD